MNYNPDFEHETKVARRPHHIAAALASIHAVIVVQTYDSVPGTCDAGLSVTTTATAKTLRNAGIHVDVWHVRNVVELANKLASYKNPRSLTHVIINTPSFVWPYPIKQTPGPESVAEFAALYPDIEFVQLNHSGMAFLSIDDHGVENIKGCLHLSMNTHNVRVAGNNPRFIEWIEDGLGGQAVLLPNLYDVTTFRKKTLRSRVDYDPLRLGLLGAGRSWKNPLGAAEAALVIGRRLGVRQLEVHRNAGRWYGDDSSKLEKAVVELFDKLPGTRLIDVPWHPWPHFREIVGNMDLLLTPSFSETFCMIVADGIAEGVPSVVTAAMEWAPRAWQAEPDNPGHIARVGMGLLHDRVGAAQDGRHALQSFVEHGLTKWVGYLTKGVN
jgi:hypothetical protein